MTRFFCAAALTLLIGGLAHAASANPPLLIEQPAAVAACQPVPSDCPPVVIAAPCPAPEPVCPPQPVCAAPAATPVRVASGAGRSAAVISHEVRAVPVTRKVQVEEFYVVNEKRTEWVDEERTRTAYRKVPVMVPATKHEVELTLIQPRSGRAPRYVRPVTQKIVPVTTYVKQPYEETYTAKVRHTVEVPVTKTRKVTRNVEEVKMVTVPVKTR
ncbi:MAG: hypothetical protein LIP77_01825 [Planctomycetes bacterium]|nr:hypothetical protein [Planctomycetota bacterium]